MSTHFIGFFASANPIFLSEDCEGVGTPSGWVNSGTVTWGDTTTVLRGAKTLLINGSANATKYPFATVPGDVWFFFMFRTASISVVPRVCSWGLDAAYQSYYLAITSGGNLRLLAGDNATTVATSAAGSLVAANVDAYLWIRYKPGTGANAEVDVYASATDTRPGSPQLSISTGTATQATDVLTLPGTASVNKRWDYIRGSTSAIGNAPA